MRVLTFAHSSLTYQQKRLWFSSFNLYKNFNIQVLVHFAFSITSNVILFLAQHQQFSSN